MGYETEADSFALEVRQGQVFPIQVPDFSTKPTRADRNLRWELINSLALWFVWRARCTRIFEQWTVPPAETILKLKNKVDSMTQMVEIAQTV